MFKVKKFVVAIGICICLFACSRVAVPEDVETVIATLPNDIDYNFQVKKILSDKCFSCHGPDSKKQKAGLRLDLDSFAYNTITSTGLAAIKPSSIHRSELVHRILSDDSAYKMPTPASHLELTNYEKAVLIKWIKQGAKYKPHWAFVAPTNETPPAVQNSPWVINDIDKFILAKIEKDSLAPAKSADKETLIRRLSFDIRGISPSVEEINRFLKDASPLAYEKVVDQFLQSAHYGERMSAYWLDVARFADSYGYLDDKHYDMSPWRDWVIASYNSNMPFNTFITWQLAGDLLPHPTQAQILATGFNRNHKQNSEAGIIDEEFRIEYVVDRTNTLGTALLATTIGCAKCHDHKYDPVSQKDYYGLSAFFNSTFEKGSPNYGNDDMVAGPTLLLSTPQQEDSIKALQAYIQNLSLKKPSIPAKSATEIQSDLQKKVIVQLDFNQFLPSKGDEKILINRVDQTNNAVGKQMESSVGVDGNAFKYNKDTRMHLPPKTVGYFERYEPFSFSFWLKIPEDYPLATIFYHTDYHKNGYQGYDVLLQNNHLNFRITHSFPHDGINVMGTSKLAKNTWHHVVISYDGSSKAAGVAMYVNGVNEKLSIENDHLIKHIRSWPSIHKAPVGGIVFGTRPLDKSMPGGEIDDFMVFDQETSAEEANYLYQNKPVFTKRIFAKSKPTELYTARKQLCDIYDSIKEVMVMGDLPKPRPTYVLKRGVYSDHGDQVFPSTPASILPFSNNYPKNRLGLAKWLFDDQNPLTSRVAVNRIWELIFGRGIVKTSDDFGNQGDLPSHPALLDYLAIWYRTHQWDTKALQKLIFMSATYRQSSITSSEIIKKDPNNILLTRNPRYRFPAEMIRDNALAISKLLSDKIGGPSVYPYQPAGLWEQLSDKVWRYPYLTSTGEDLYRKSIYTIRKRTTVVPFLQIFDAPDRNLCTVRRTHSSSPMQSLALLNDPQMNEAARWIGWRMLSEAGSKVDDQLGFGFQLITGRRPNPKEVSVLQKMYQAESANYVQYPEKVKKYLMIGSKMVPTEQSVALATHATIALALMNTDEFITRK